MLAPQGRRGGDIGSEAVVSSPLPGESMHRKIPPECWCVTKRDLRELRREVREAICEGRIAPTKMDMFDPRDNEVGPNFYTVVEQYIMPVTAASRASWALARNPHGLKCDLFVTHAWVEGIFEFIDKLLASWPARAKHAWICTLSMPQHLNIADLISSPRDSPFARALHSAPQVIVVPNRECSIYLRLWCVYEAFLAQQQGKIIRTAVRTPWRSLAMALVRIVTFCMIGLGFGLVARFAWHEDSGQDWKPGLAHGKVDMAIWVLMCLSIFSGGSHVRCFVNSVGLVLASYLLAGEDYHKLHDAAYFLVAEIDRVRLRAYKAEARNLVRDFGGSVLHANCSRHADADAIWTEIGDAVGAVDKTVEVLIKAKQSTPLWSHLAGRGYYVRDVGFMEWAFPAYTLASAMYHGWQVVDACHDDGCHELDWHAGLKGCTVIAHCLWGVMFALFENDRRVFSVHVLEKTTSIFFVAHACMKAVAVSKVYNHNDHALNVPVDSAVEPRKTHGHDVLHQVHECGAEMRLAISLLALLLCALPPMLFARIPCVGPFILNFVLRRIRVRCSCRSLLRVLRGVT